MVINSPQKPQNQFKMPLELHWSFGFNPSVCPHVHSLSGSNEQIILYSAAHTGIIYNIDTNTQISLQGHCNSITSAICTQDKDKRWLVTADAGSDSIIIVWDRTSAAPVKTIFDPHNGSGTVAMDISRDCKYLVTLGAGMPQTLSVWEWATDNNSPLVKYEFDDSQEDYQTFIQVNPQDPFEFVTNGAKTISFFRWSPAGVQRFKPTERGNRRSTTFTQSCFVPNTTQAVSATKEGDVVVYDCINIGNIASKQQKENKTAIKRINHLHSHAINTITTYDDKYIVTGGDDGFIRVYDLQFKLLAFLEKLQAGPISSMSLNHGGCKSLFDEIYIPDIFISTKTSKILHIQRENKTNQPTITALLEAPSSPIKALATNPTTSDYVVGDDYGSLQIWDYEGKAVKSFRQFSEMGKITCAMYCREGTHIAVGFDSGFLVIVLTEDLDGNHVAKLQLSQSSILRLSFSDDSKYLAFSDGQHAVGLLQNLPSAGWSLVGKFKSHSKEITALLFNSVKATSRPPALVSISRDRTLVEYDLPASNVENGLKIRHIKGLEQSAEPLACVWVPPLKDEPDGVLIASNSEFKLRIYKESTYVCKKTVLGPTYSECLNRLNLLPSTGPPYYMCFSTAEKVIGLIKLPLDGNPHKSAGLIAHPGEISNVVVSHDGKYLLTCGHNDCTVNLWSVNTDALEAQVAFGGSGMEPFLRMLNTGENFNDEFREMEDLFYYAQLRSQGEDTMTKRRISQTVNITEIPSILRSYGYYPSEEDIANIFNEIKLAAPDKDQHTISFDDLLKIYLNHRPIFPISEHKISDALEVALSATKNIAEKDNEAKLTMERLLLFLQTYGEPIDKSQFDAYFRILKNSMSPKDGGRDNVGVGLLGKTEIKMEEEITTKSFVEEILGFKVISE